MLTNLVSSALFVLLGLTVVNGWLRGRDARRLRLVVVVAAASVGRFLLAYRRTMWLLLYGGRFLGDPDFEVSDERLATLRAVLARHQLSEIDEHLAVSDDDGVAAVQMHARLCVLAADLEWVQLAHDLLRNTFFRSRIVLSRWAPLLVTSDVSSAALWEMAEQVHGGGDLFLMFRNHIHQDRSHRDHSHQEHPAGFASEDVAELALRWRMVFTNAVVLDWRLTALTGQQARVWPTDGRNLLLPVDRQTLHEPGHRWRARPSVSRPYRSPDTLPRWIEPPPIEPAGGVPSTDRSGSTDPVA